ncbi:MAG: hypothetical protein JXL97_03695 [Bacteroidales bacterium]|nr:hypothetical protein [Bacteroidales bacterium]
MSDIIFQQKLISVQKKGNCKGILTLTAEKIYFVPDDNDFDYQEELIRRIVQVGAKRYFRFIIAYKFYLKSRSGKVYYFYTYKARKWANFIIKLVY